jgi:hypothetical protein
VRRAVNRERHSKGRQQKKATFTTFDPPGSIFTQPTSINPAGIITGYYFDGSDVAHGFLRAKGGAITTFDAPGAGTGLFQGTAPFSINSGGAIAGFYVDDNNLLHDFLRRRDGTFTTFDAPGAGTGPGEGTQALNINPAEAIGGYYLDQSNVRHDFLRTPDGAITTFDAPGAGTGPFQGTFTAGVDGLNPAGTVTGYYLDGSNVYHGYVRDPDGTISTFDAPGAGTGPFQGTDTSGITPAAKIVGMELKQTLFDLKTQKWQELTSRLDIGYPNWSRDGKYIYYDAGAGDQAGFYRVRVSDHKVERMVSLKDIRRAGSIGWAGLAPDDSPLLLRDTSTQEIYALDVDLP